MTGYAAFVIRGIVVCSYVNHGVRFNLQVAAVAKEKWLDVPFLQLEITCDIDCAFPCVVADRPRDDSIKCNGFIPNFQVGFVEHLPCGSVCRELADILQIDHTAFRAWVFVTARS